jgi:NAD(P)-dependent dehydrogenase (short-subunit alcohol dehydrogenase family)
VLISSQPSELDVEGTMVVTLPYFDVSGQVVVVTGAGRGIGRVLVSDLCASSATVVACSRTQVDLDSLREEVSGAGGEVVTIRADLSETKGIHLLISETLDVCGRIDGIVNNAGWDRRREAVDYTEEEVDALLNINLRSAYWSCVLAARAMMSLGTGGSIVNISSQAGILGSVGRAPYSAAKAGLINLTRSLASEWARDGIRVNGVAPGPTLTRQVAESLEQHPELAREVQERMLNGRAAYPHEVTAPILFLLSPAASMITGHTLVVDGGWTAAWSISRPGTRGRPASVPGS